MRTVKVQVQSTLDGFMCGPHGEQDWITPGTGEDFGNYVTPLLKDVDTILLGRELASTFIPFWRDNPEVPGAEFFNSIPRVVVSSTLTPSPEPAPWENTRILPAPDFTQAISELKAQEGGSIMAYGGAKLVNGLIENNLADEIHLFINPVAIGSGLPTFGATRSDFQRESVTTLECGVTVMKLVPATSNPQPQPL